MSCFFSIVVSDKNIINRSNFKLWKHSTKNMHACKSCSLVFTLRWQWIVACAIKYCSIYSKCIMVILPQNHGKWILYYIRLFPADPHRPVTKRRPTRRWWLWLMVIRHSNQRCMHVKAIERNTRLSHFHVDFLLTLLFPRDSLCPSSGARITSFRSDSHLKTLVFCISSFILMIYSVDGSIQCAKCKWNARQTLKSSFMRKHFILLYMWMWMMFGNMSDGSDSHAHRNILKEVHIFMIW